MSAPQRREIGRWLGLPVPSTLAGFGRTTAVHRGINRKRSRHVAVCPGELFDFLSGVQGAGVQRINAGYRAGHHGQRGEQDGEHGASGVGHPRLADAWDLRPPIRFRQQGNCLIARRAVSPNGAFPASHHASRADQRTEFHECLIVRPGRLAGPRQERAGDGPERLPSARGTRIHSGSKDPPQDARHVRVDQRRPPFVRE